MPLQTNYVTRQHPNSIPPEDAQAWLDANPQNKAENLTGKLSTAPFVLGRDYEAAKQDRAAKKENTKPVLKRIMVNTVVSAPKKPKNHDERPDVKRYHLAVKHLHCELSKGLLVTLEDLTPHSKQTVLKMISQLRSKSIDVLTVRRGNALVGWVLDSTLDKGNR